MRTISLIIVHCSAVRPYQESGVSEIDRWHKARGWKNGCGYHYVIRRDGTIEIGRPLSMVGAHCQYHNRHSIGICYEGGLDLEGRPADTRTRAQRQAMRQLLEQLHSQFPKALTWVTTCSRPRRPVRASTLRRSTVICSRIEFQVSGGFRFQVVHT